MSCPTANSWKIGLAVAALALPLGQAQAQAIADEEQSETLEVRSVPLEPKSVPVILLPAANEAVFTQRPTPTEDVPVIMVQTAKNRETAQPSSQPPEPLKEARIPQEEAPLAESPASPEPQPRVAALPATSDPAVASPPAEPEKVRKDVAPVIPALPGRSPFRQVPFKSEIVEATPDDDANVQQVASQSFSASIEEVEEAPENDKPPIKRILDGLQFWKK